MKNLLLGLFFSSFIFANEQIPAPTQKQKHQIQFMQIYQVALWLLRFGYGLVY